MINFDNFHNLSSFERKFILNDLDELKELVKTNLKTERYLHSLSVADVCKDLALIHKVDPLKAYKAGILHDVCKYLSIEEMDEYLKYYDKDKLNYPKGVKHSFVAKYYLKEKLNYHDKDILNAIYNHAVCNSKDKLSLILYIADKREPLRNIDDDILKIAYKDLYLAYDLLVKDVEKYVRSNDGQFIRGNS